MQSETCFNPPFCSTDRSRARCYCSVCVCVLISGRAFFLILSCVGCACILFVHFCWNCLVRVKFVDSYF